MHAMLSSILRIDVVSNEIDRCDYKIVDTKLQCAEIVRRQVAIVNRIDNDACNQARYGTEDEAQYTQIKVKKCDRS